MKHLRLPAWLMLFTLMGCGTLYDDTGSQAPGDWWPWVCPDGTPAPDAGCPVMSEPDGGLDGGTPDGGS